MASLERIEGIGKKYAKAMAACGVRTTEGLLKEAATKKGRKSLAERSGCSEAQILEWVNRADLMRVRGVGEEYSDLLERAGVDSVKELRRRKPENLHAALLETNARSRGRLVRRPPSLSEVERWVAHAKELAPVVTH